MNRILFGDNLEIMKLLPLASEKAHQFQRWDERFLRKCLMP